MKELRSLKKWVSDYENAKQHFDDLEVLFDFIKKEKDENEVHESHTTLLSILEDINFEICSPMRDSLSAVLQITAGAGEPKVVTGLKC